MKRIFKIGNFSHSLTEWSEISGIKRGTIASRLDRGQSPVEAIFCPTPNIVYTVYDRKTDDILAVSKTAEEISDLFGISRGSVLSYTADVSKGKYKLVREDGASGKEIYQELVKKGMIK